MEIASQLAGIAGVFALLAGALWWLRRTGFARFGAPRPDSRRRMARIERLPLTPHHALYLVRVANREMLIAVHPAGCALLDSAPAREEARP